MTNLPVFFFWRMPNETIILHDGNSTFFLNVFWLGDCFKLFTLHQCPKILVHMVTHNEKPTMNSNVLSRLICSSFCSIIFLVFLSPFYLVETR